MQHGGDTDPCAEALGIAGDGERRLGRGLHQQVIDYAPVLVGDVTQLAGQRVDDVKIRHWQQLRFAVGQPSACRCPLTLGAMSVAAGVVRNLRIAARRVLAACDMAAERRRAAALDRTHHLQLLEAHMAAVGLTPSRAVIAEDVRDLQSWSRHGRPRLWRRRRLPVSLRTPAASLVQALQRALDLGNHSDRHATVASCRLDPIACRQWDRLCPAPDYVPSRYDPVCDQCERVGGRDIVHVVTGL